MVDNTDYGKIGQLTPSEAVEVLKVYEKYACDSSQMRGTNAFIMAIEALEKQIPKKPKNIRNITFNGSMNSVFSEGECPNCGEYVDTDDNKHVCGQSGCGQAISWEVEE